MDFDVWQRKTWDILFDILMMLLNEARRTKDNETWLAALAKQLTIKAVNNVCKRDLWYHILNTQILVYQRDCDLNWNSLRESYHSEREQQAFFRPNFGFCPKQSSPPFGTHNLQDVIAKVTCLDSFTEEYFLLPKNDPSPLPKKNIDRLNSNTFWILLIHVSAKGHL